MSLASTLSVDNLSAFFTSNFSILSPSTPFNLMSLASTLSVDNLSAFCNFNFSIFTSSIGLPVISLLNIFSASILPSSKLSLSSSFKPNFFLKPSKVLAPTIPSAFNPASFCIFITASLVLGPKIPSDVTPNKVCSALTPSPLEPTLRLPSVKTSLFSTKLPNILSSVKSDFILFISSLILVNLFISFFLILLYNNKYCQITKNPYQTNDKDFFMKLNILIS